MAKQRVFVDTNIILEAFRTGCWSTITTRFSIETVDKCVEEALTGDPDEPGRVDVDPEHLRAQLSGRHQVSDLALARFALAHPEWAGLDDGERHLIAWLKDMGLLGNAMIAISTADRAAVTSAFALECNDSLISLEELVATAGGNKSSAIPLRHHFSKQWLSQLKTVFLLKGMR